MAAGIACIFLFGIMFVLEDIRNELRRIINEQANTTHTT